MRRFKWLEKWLTLLIRGDVQDVLYLSGENLQEDQRIILVGIVAGNMEITVKE